LGGNTKYWAEDNATVESIVVAQLPANSVQICSANNTFNHDNVDPDESIVWYNDGKNFFYFGDSTGATASNDSQNDSPALYVNGIPKSKPYGNYNTTNRVIPYVYIWNLMLLPG